MSKQARFFSVALLFLLLVAVRVFLQPCFYDPLISYFKNEYLYTTIPDLNFSKYFLHVFFRYVINTIISLVIIYVVFMQKKVMVFSIKFYVFSFVLLSCLLLILLKYKLTEGHMFVFYIRRFLMHPIFLLILLPAFYYQQLKSNKN